ncbi:MAG: hypothetical protein CM1200mP2_34690 [Planctomycetaceae bacterium]|nr:MAG: hypothetical protein CM1200mP2_34690 [Planctomycetaceae bacterium]
MLGCEPSQMIKTLIYSLDDEPVAVLVEEITRPTKRRSDEPSEPRRSNCPTPDDHPRTGAPVGFAGPVGLDCPLLADHDVAQITDGITGANQGDAHLTGVNIGRDTRWTPHTT